MCPDGSVLELIVKEHSPYLTQAGVDTLLAKARCARAALASAPLRDVPRVKTVLRSPRLPSLPLEVEQRLWSRYKTVPECFYASAKGSPIGPRLFSDLLSSPMSI